MRRSVQLRGGEEEITVDLSVSSARAIDFFVGDECVAARATPGGWQLDGSPAPVAARVGDDVFVFSKYGLAFEVVDPLDRTASAAGDGNLIEAPMPGLVKAIYAKAGQPVSAGDRLAVLEAMKMEHALLAARDGVVAEILSSEGSQVEAGAPLVRLEDQGEDA